MGDLLREHGWAKIPDVTTDRFVEIARGLGKPLHRPSGIIEKLVIRNSEDAPSRSLSGIYGRGEFPLHTDFATHAVPPRYVILRNVCTEPVRPTMIQPLSELLHSDGVSRILRRRVWAVRGGPTAFYAPVLFGAAAFVRWDAACMFPISATAEAATTWGRCLALSNPIHIDWGVNTVLIVDNWRTLHGRGGGAMASDSERIIERIVVS